MFVASPHHAFKAQLISFVVMSLYDLTGCCCMLFVTYCMSCMTCVFPWLSPPMLPGPRTPGASNVLLVVPDAEEDIDSP